MPGSKATAKPKKPKAYKLPKPLPEGEILTEHSGKRKWRIGSIIGQGGFGYIYLASDNVNTKVKADAEYVLKIEPQGNGPLFVELHFYQRAAKEDMLEQYQKSQNLPYLGVPKFISTGLHETNNMKYRFMVMQRFGEDLYKKLQATNQKFTPKVTYMLAKRILTTLEYLHDKGYIHADIKAANLMMGYGPKASNQVFLVDYGLAYRYLPDGEHKPYKEDPRKAHDGTLEYTSCDAHKGVVPSRRADIEILGYNILHWLSGTLPWQGTQDPDAVSAMKQKLMSDVGTLMSKCFKGKHFAGEAEVKKYLKYAHKLSYEQKPDYNCLRQLFDDALKKNGLKDDGKFDFESVVSGPETKRKTTVKRKSDDGYTSNGSPVKRVRSEKVTSSGESSPEKKKRAAAGKRKVTSSSSITSPGKEQIPKAKQMRGSRNKKPVCSISSPESSPEKKLRRSPRKLAASKGKPVKKAVRNSRRKVQTMDTEIQTSPGLLHRYLKENPNYNKS
ncbi:serine/threonine-protein kinase VRK1-like [Anneissia japonica]|uniref:serine/threonine-protein kinase VRK1-like n=1 Tax=Anneissia japonica TaxID=1529436 RepID=UPI00142553C4|nr:serine/threonine-protein kinase VRK1-like [Anneissia japonica]